MYQINTRNTLNLHNVTCQLYFNLQKRKRKCSSFWEEAKDNGWAKKLATFFLVAVAMLEIYIYAHSIARKWQSQNSSLTCECVLGQITAFLLA